MKTSSVQAFASGARPRRVLVVRRDRFELVLGVRRGSGRPGLGPDAELYREDDGAGTVSYRRYPGGPLHRERGPALIQARANGTRIESYYRDGLLHRDDGPARVRRHPSGAYRRSYYRDGLLDRDDGPAEIVTRPDGERTESYYRDGRRHRDDGPAETVTRSDYLRVDYWRDGVRHRDDGPAVVKRFGDGSNQLWYYRAGRFRHTSSQKM